MKVDSQEVAGNIAYNAADQTTSIKIGAADANQVTENYIFDQQTGLLTNQKVLKSGQTLLDLSYDYNRNNSVGTLNGKTGHLTKIIDNLNNNKNREYEFDALGRLTKAKGGNGGNLWTQQYSYDRYGNRTNVVASGVAADNTTIPRDGIPNLTYNTQTNRITTAGFEYDVAGNQTRAQAEDGTWLRYDYDAANRLQVVKKDDGTYLQAFQFGSTNARLMSHDYLINQATMIASSGGTTLAEYTEFTPVVMTWTKSYTYLGDSQLSTITRTAQGGEQTEFNHPDKLGTRTITNQALGTSYEQTTLPFGTALNAESTTSLSKRFTSYERSTLTGLDYAVNRTYDSKQGRFTQVDPIGMNASSLDSPQTFNLYSYCGNDPINHTDPNGLFFGSLFKVFKAIFKVLRIVVAVLTAVAAVLAFAIGQPGIGIQLAMTSLQLWATISGNKTFQKLIAIAGIAVSIYRTHFGGNVGTTPPIFPFQADDDILATVTVKITFGSIIGKAISAIAQFLLRNAERFWGWLKGAASWAWGGIKSGLSWTWEGTKSAGRWVGNKAQRGWGKLRRLVTGEKEVVFKTEHASRHLPPGLNVADVETAIFRDVQNVVRNTATTGSFWGRVTVQGSTIEYRAFTLPNGTINIGTYYIP